MIALDDVCEFGSSGTDDSEYVQEVASCVVNAIANEIVEIGELVSLLNNHWSGQKFLDEAIGSEGDG